MRIVIINLLHLKNRLGMEAVLYGKAEMETLFHIFQRTNTLCLQHLTWKMV